MMSARNAIPATIRDLRDAGGRALVYFDIGANLVAEVTPAAAERVATAPRHPSPPDHQIQQHPRILIDYQHLEPHTQSPFAPLRF